MILNKVGANQKSNAEHDDSIHQGVIDIWPIKGNPTERAKGIELSHLNAIIVPLNNEGDVWATTSGITKAISRTTIQPPFKP